MHKLSSNRATDVGLAFQKIGIVGRCVQDTVSLYGSLKDGKNTNTVTSSAVRISVYTLHIDPV